MSSWILNGSIGFKPAVQPHENMPMTQSPLLRCSFPPILQEGIHQAHIFDTAESRVSRNPLPESTEADRAPSSRPALSNQPDEPRWPLGQEEQHREESDAQYR
jgi:hypothetical protein